MKSKHTHVPSERKTKIRILKLRKRGRTAILILSLFVNGYLIHKLELFNRESKSTVIVKTDGVVQKEMVSKIFNLSNYKSVSKFSASAQDRFDRLVRGYAEDSKTPKEKRYINGKLRDDWSRRCVDRVRRITNLQARVYDLEVVLGILFNGVEATHVTEAMEATKYEERLAEMSNYYAGFLDEYSYNLIVRRVD